MFKKYIINIVSIENKVYTKLLLNIKTRDVSEDPVRQRLPPGSVGGPGHPVTRHRHLQQTDFRIHIVTDQREIYI